MILVTIINGEDLSLSDSKVFADDEKAKEYFIQLCQDYFPEYCKDYTDDDFNESYQDGYFCDLTHFSVYAQEISIG